MTVSVEGSYRSECRISMLGEMGAYFGQGVVILLHIWSTIKKSSPLLAKKINSPPMGTETSLERDTGSSYGLGMTRAFEIKLLLADRRRRKLLSRKLRNLILRTWLWFGLKDEDDDLIVQES